MNRAAGPNVDPGVTRDTFGVAGRSVLVAGASGGLGSAIAADLAGRGARLTLVARDAQRLARLDVAGHKVALDLRDPSACESAVAAAIDHAGQLDVVVNAVGVVAFGTVAELSVDVMEELFMTNTFVPIMLSRAALTSMADGGVIVNISGIVAEQAVSGMAAYGASKAVVHSFDEALAREVRRRRIRVIDARPPHTETGLATRPIHGQAPRMPVGLDPAMVASIIGDAIAGDVVDLPSGAFVR